MASGQIEKRLDREMEKKARTIYLDVVSGQPYIWLRAWPIQITAPAPLIYNDCDHPPLYATALVSGADYVVYEDEDGRGQVAFLASLAGGPRALKIIYTGGMAGATTQVASQSGNDGATVVAGNIFTAATGLFITNSIQPGDMLTITGGGDAGTYSVYAVQSETALLINPLTPWPTGGLVNQTWALTSQVAGFVALYPDVATACELQTAYLFNNRDKFGLMSLGVSGGNVAISTTRPIDISSYGSVGLVPEVHGYLENFRRRIA
jgi:hypothetical protein